MPPVQRDLKAFTFFIYILVNFSFKNSDVIAIKILNANHLHFHRHQLPKFFSFYFGKYQSFQFKIWKPFAKVINAKTSFQRKKHSIGITIF